MLNQVNHRPIKPVLLALMLLVVALMALALSAQAATLMVTNTNDSGPGSLRQALADANDGDTITFALSYPATITLTSGQLNIAKAVTIDGPGADHLAISGNSVSRVISATEMITITGVTIRDGNVVGDGGGVWAGFSATLSDTALIGNAASSAGGGLYVDADLRFSGAAAQDRQVNAGDDGATSVGLSKTLSRLTIYDSLLQGNVAGEVGGAVVCSVAVISNTRFLTNTALAGYAGAAYVETYATVSHSTFQGNQAAIDTGALEVGASLTMSDTLFLGNHALDGHAGGLFLSGYGLRSLSLDPRKSLKANMSLWGSRERAERPDALALTSNRLTYPGYSASTIVNTRFEGNSSAGVGGGLLAFPYWGTSLVLDRATFDDNTAAFAGGGAAIIGPAMISSTQFVENTLTDQESFGAGLLLGATFWTVAADPGLKGLATTLAETGVQSSRFEGNVSPGFGGGFYILPLALGVSDVEPDDLEPEIFWLPTVISNTSIISNTAGHGGAGLASEVAGITMVDCTVAGNVVEGLIEDGRYYGGGGGMLLTDMAEATLTNVTIANNQALGVDDDGGGGIMVYALADEVTTTLHLQHVTIADNLTASTSDWGTGGGGISQFGDCMVVMTNTLMAGNTSAAGAPDIAGLLVSHGGNLIGSTDGCTCTLGLDDQWGTNADPLDALIGPLGAYGGDTETVPLLPGSPAINRGSPLAGVLVDQRGVERDGGVDVGAFESRGFTLTYASGSPQSQAILAQFALPLVADVNSAYGEPVDGGVVAYTAPSLGASASFAPDNLATISGGQASILATANGLVGSYVVQASIPTLLPRPTMANSVNGVYFDLTNLPVSGEAQFSGGPATLCPGHNIYYSVVVTNTSPLATMYGLTVTGTVPTGTEYYGDSSQAGGAYHAGAGGVVWSLPPLAAGESITIDWTVHVLRGIADGTVIEGQSRWSSQALAGGTQTMTVTVDTTDCGPTPPPDLTIIGGVYGGNGVAPTGDARLRTPAPIAGAIVTATTCVAGQWVAVTDDQGQYEITIPGQVVEQCDTVTLDVTAEGYGAATGTWSVVDLRQNNVRDFVLDPWYYYWLPLLFR